MAKKELSHTENTSIVPQIVFTDEEIRTRILTIRGIQVVMDADLAEFYQVKTIALNQAVKRNESRFPERYRFQLTEEEKTQLITLCDRFRNLKHSPYLPYAFTEQGITQLSAVLHSAIAVEMSIRINDAFHAMRKFLLNNAAIFQRLEAVELKQITTDKKIDQILDQLDDGSLKQKLGIFFDGFSSIHLPVQLVYFEEYANEEDAIKREKQLKGWTRVKKEKLISGEWKKQSLS